MHLLDIALTVCRSPESVPHKLRIKLVVGEEIQMLCASDSVQPILGERYDGHRFPHLVEEDASEVLPVREDLCLPGQVGSPAVHQVHAGQAAAGSNLLEAQMLLCRGEGPGGGGGKRGKLGHT